MFSLIFFGSSKTSLKGVGQTFFGASELFFGTKNLKRACIISGEIIATSHDLGRQKVAEVSGNGTFNLREI